MSNKKNVKVGIANVGEQNMSVDEIKDWKTKIIYKSGDSVVFEVEKETYIMKMIDYKEIFGS